MTETPVDNFIGFTLRDRYRIEEIIGRGGMATVYRAHDTSLDRSVAVKLFRVESTDADDLHRQRAEMQVLARLSHPGLVTLFDAGVEESAEPTNGRGYLVMELVDGANLGDYLLDGPLQPLHVSAIGAEMAEALSHIHRYGVIHRDVKPANILLMPPDIPGAAPHVKLTDFGIAIMADLPRVTGAGAVIGTANYLSPEQALGKELTPATDLYSLGLVLLECLTGERPFGGTALESARARILNGPSIPHLPHGWTSLLSSMTEREPENRPSAVEVAKACRRILHRSTAAATEAETTQLLDLTRVMDVATTNPHISSTPVAVPDGHSSSVFGAAASSLTLSEAPANASAVPAAAVAPTAAIAPAAAIATTGTAAAPTGTAAAPTANARPSSTHASAKPNAASGALAQAHNKRIRTTVWTWVVAALIAASAGAVSIAGAPETPPVPTYPHVTGVLGEHLQDLQKSVEP